MVWEKIGKICDADTFALPWYRKNSMVPLPYLLNEDCIRIFLTMCDADNVGRIGYVDVKADNPTEIIDYSKEPLIEIGENGRFDDNGVVTSSLLEEDGKLYLFYSGYQLCVKVPYLIFSGVAVSEDNGRSFKKLTKDVPILDRISGESQVRSAPYVLKEDNKYKMWYTADAAGTDGWIAAGEKLRPFYDLKYTESDDIFNWKTRGMTSITRESEDEYGIGKGTIWKENGTYKMIYSLRLLSKGYRLGYAESPDGKTFKRMDEKVGITVSENGFDSEMICFPERIRVKDKTYLFYCGNHYGIGGIGCAILNEVDR